MELYKIAWNDEIVAVKNCKGETNHFYIFQDDISIWKVSKKDFYLTRKLAVQHLIETKQNRLAILRQTLEELPDRIAILNRSIEDLKKEL